MSDPHAPTSDTAAFDDEPRTPMWLPALGAALFLVVGIVWAIAALSHKGDAAQAATVAPSAPSAAAPLAAPARPAAPPPPSAAPAGQAGGHEGLIRKTPAIRQ